MMKKFLILLLAFGIFSSNTLVIAGEVEKTVHNDAPKWEEYVAPKYRDPHTDYTRGCAINQLVWGGVLTSLIITCPIGIPLLVVGTQRVKMSSYENRKKIFDEQIAQVQLIEDDAKRKAEYRRILEKCNLKESTRQHYAKKEGRVLSN